MTVLTAMPGGGVHANVLLKIETHGEVSTPARSISREDLKRELSAQSAIPEEVRIHHNYIYYIYIIYVHYFYIYTYTCHVMHPAR